MVLRVSLSVTLGLIESILDTISLDPINYQGCYTIDETMGRRWLCQSNMHLISTTLCVSVLDNFVAKQRQNHIKITTNSLQKQTNFKEKNIETTVKQRYINTLNLNSLFDLKRHIMTQNNTLYTSILFKASAIIWLSIPTFSLLQCMFLLLGLMGLLLWMRP